ncbi:hypothetical protein BDDG_12793 [Blastomyces dermatitidis ATCC 18188]|uniref:Uncharacterized protein n=1 Tax=Ajellomyces dermatitidis (strain ATCC 18188 / CBS 674.68) TaxID=653446 RepID=A0A0J9EQ02_AJEDA|nr:hypothetical protein BDDG_12793 [Blastomyces dermatitidis ATCC 18188]
MCCRLSDSQTPTGVSVDLGENMQGEGHLSLRLKMDAVFAPHLTPGLLNQHQNHLRQAMSIWATYHLPAEWAQIGDSHQNRANPDKQFKRPSPASFPSSRKSPVRL